MHYRDWYAADPRRRVPEVDYGHVWTDQERPGEQWSVSWNPGTGELYTFNRATGDVAVLARYATTGDVDEALAGWADHALQYDGMAWLRSRTAPAQPDRRRDPVYGVVARTDGRLELLHEPVEHSLARRLLDEATMTTATVATAHSTPGELMMFVDDDGHAKQLPINPTGTALYGTGWPIRGDIVVCHHDDRPLRHIELCDIAQASTPLPPPRPADHAAVYGIVVGADGRRMIFNEPVTTADAHDALRSTHTHVETAYVQPGTPDDLMMHVADQHRPDLAPNHYATLLHRGGKEINGDVVVCRTSSQPLHRGLVADLLGDLDHASRTLPLRTDADLRHQLDCARRYQAAYRRRPLTSEDPYVSTMRTDNERDIVRLVATLDARTNPPPLDRSAPALPPSLPPPTAIDGPSL